MKNEQSFLIVPAAGIGERASQQVPKQYVLLNNKSILEHTLDLFLDSGWFQKIVLALHPADLFFTKTALIDKPQVMTVIGGETRQTSVLNALKVIENQAQDHDWVYVHDAVRPCLHPSDLNKLRAELKDHPVGGLLGQPAQDTLKQVENQCVQKTLDRSKIWNALTPQVFRFKLLLNSILLAQQHQILITDDCSCIEYAGFKPKMVQAMHPNPKFTYAKDLSYIAFLLEAREAACALE